MNAVSLCADQSRRAVTGRQTKSRRSTSVTPMSIRMTKTDAGSFQLGSSTVSAKQTSRTITAGS
jgi:hypothetical protein